MSLDLISSLLASQLAMGGLVGFLIGFALKKIMKIALVLAGVFFLTVGYLEYNHYITVNYTQMELEINHLLHKAGTNLVLPSFLAMNVPLLGSFGAALALGLKKG